MPTLLVNDTLQTYGVGRGFPANFSSDNIIFDAEFINFNTIRPPTPAPGFYERQGIGFFFFGNNLQFPLNANLSSNAVSDTSVFWAGFNFASFGLLSLQATPPYYGPTLISFKLESDYSITANIPGVPFINSLKQVYFENTWQYYQIDISIGIAIVGGVHVATVQFSMAVDGVPIFVTAGGTTTIPIADMYLNSNLVNAWQWSGSSYYGEFTIYQGLQPIPYYPNSVGPINMLESQAVIEYAKLPSESIRVSQMVNETVQKPSERNARVSQMVIELILAGSFGQNGFYVRES